MNDSLSISRHHTLLIITLFPCMVPFFFFLSSPDKPNMAGWLSLSSSFSERLSLNMGVSLASGERSCSPLSSLRESWPSGGALRLGTQMSKQTTKASSQSTWWQQPSALGPTAGASTEASSAPASSPPFPPQWWWTGGRHTGQARRKSQVGTERAAVGDPWAHLSKFKKTQSAERSRWASP